jgi:hypothetical protein
MYLELKIPSGLALFLGFTAVNDKAFCGTKTSLTEGWLSFLRV